MAMLFSGNAIFAMIATVMNRQIMPLMTIFVALDYSLTKPDVNKN
jgi:hypothetical protein